MKVNKRFRAENQNKQKKLRMPKLNNLCLRTTVMLDIAGHVLIVSSLLFLGGKKMSKNNLSVTVRLKKKYSKLECEVNTSVY